MLGRVDRASESRSNVTASLPKVLWLLWLQGWSEAPPVARACLTSWRRLNPGWEVRAIDGAGFARYVSPEAFARIAAVPKEPEAFSDQIRIEILHLHALELRGPRYGDDRATGADAQDIARSASSSNRH